MKFWVTGWAHSAASLASTVIKKLIEMAMTENRIEYALAKHAIDNGSTLISNVWLVTLDRKYEKYERALARRAEKT